MSGGVRAVRFSCQVAGQQDAFLADLQLKPIEEKRLRKLLQAPALKIPPTSNSDWWFGTCFIFPCIGNNHPSCLIFFSGVQTTNQNLSMAFLGIP